jgi:hypothetical protein
MDAAVDSPATDSSVVDSSVADSTVADSSSADTGVPPTDAPIDAPSSWCASQPATLAFCDDFDENPLPVGFDGIDTNNCTLQLATGNDTSPPKAMSAVSENNLPSSGCEGVKAFPSLGATATTYTLAFDIYPLQADRSINSDAVAASIQLSDAAGVLWWLQFDLAWNSVDSVLTPSLDMDSDLADGGERYAQNAASAPLPMNQWSRVTMTLSVGAHNVPQSATLSLGSRQVASTSTLLQTTSNPTVALTIGYSYVSTGNASWSMLYDNVTFAAN